MLLPTRPTCEGHKRVRRYRHNVRLIVACALLACLLAATTIVSAAALRRLPEVLRVASIDADELVPTLAAPFPSTESSPTDETSNVAAPFNTEAAPATQEAPAEAVRHLTTADYAESWNQAGPRRDIPGQMVRSHQVDVGRRGRLVGKLVTLDPQTGRPGALSNVNVWLSHGGIIAATAKTDDNGVFDVEGLSTGSHALFASDEDTILTYALHVRQVELAENNAVDSDVEDGPPTEIALESAAATGPDVAIVLSQIAGAPSASPEVEEIEPDDLKIPELVRSLKQIGTLATTLSTQPIRLQDDGRLVGLARRLHSETGRPLLPPLTDVTLLQDGVLVVSSRTDERGWFSLPDVEAGFYTVFAKTVPEEQLIAAVEDDETHPVAVIDEMPQPQGVAAFAIQVLPAADGDDPLQIEPVAMQADNEAPALEFALSDMSDMFAFTRAVASQTESTNRGSLPGNGSLSSDSRGLPAPSAGSAPQTVINNPPAGGGGGGGIPLPLSPSSPSSDPVMSPATL